jgi:tetratricopeptide (TPR) repeat protein
MSKRYVSYTGPEFNLAGGALKKNWAELHRGNLEPFPGSAKARKAWQAYHEGRFGDAVRAGEKHGDECLLPAAFAATMYAHYVENDDDEKLGRFEHAVDLAERAAEFDPDSANAHFMLAVALGRYSQFINIIEALAKGIAPRVKDSLTQCLDIEPEHAEAHAALAAWHAEIVDTLGSMLASLRFGAKRRLAEEHFDTAIELCPDSSFPYIEKANGLILMYGDDSEDEVRELLETAVSMTPIEAMQALDIDRAESQLINWGQTPT